MRTALRTPALLAALLLALLAPALHAQNLPQKSPKSTSTQVVGLTDVTIEYSRPSLRGRKVFGSVVPFGELWRTGANATTSIAFSDDVKLGGQRLSAGKYALFTIPGQDEWTVILNKRWNASGTDGYDKTLDVLTLKVPVRKGPATETFTISLTDLTEKGTANLKLNWDDVEIALTLEADPSAKAWDSAKSAADNAWNTLARSARYCLDSNTNLEQGLVWVDQSLAIKESFFNTWVKAQLLAATGKKQEALAQAQKAKEVGLKEGDAGWYRFYKNDVEKALTDWAK